MRILSIIPACLLIAACGSEETGSFEGENGETGSYSIDEESGTTTAEINTKDGTATLRSGENVPIDLPEGFSIYPGAKVTSNTTFSLDDAQGALVTFESSDKPEAIAAFYRKQAETAGIEIELEMTVNGNQTLGGKSETGRTFTLNVSSDGGISNAQLMVGKKLGS